MKDQRIIMQQDKRTITQQIEYAESLVHPVADLIEELNALNLGAFNMAEITSFVSNPAEIEAEVRERTVADLKSASIGGLKVSREKLLEMVEIPDVAAARVAASRVAGAFTTMQRQNPDFRPNTSLFELVDNVPQLKQSVIQSLTDRHTIYAETPEQEEAYRVLTEVTEKLNYLFGKYDIPVKWPNNTGANCLFFSEGLYNGSGKTQVQINASILKHGLHLKHKSEISPGITVPQPQKAAA